MIDDCLALQLNLAGHIELDDLQVPDNQSAFDGDEDAAEMQVSLQLLRRIVG